MDYSKTRASALVVAAGGDCLDIFLSSIISLLFPFINVVVEWLKRLGYGTAGRGFEFRIGQLGFENSLCKPRSKWVLLFESGKDKAVKGEEWAKPFICSGPQAPTAPTTATRLW